MAEKKILEPRVKRENLILTKIKMNHDANYHQIYIGELDLNEDIQYHFIFILKDDTLLADSDQDSSNLSARNQQDLAAQINLLTKKTTKQLRNRRNTKSELSKLIFDDSSFFF